MARSRPGPRRSAAAPPSSTPSPSVPSLASATLPRVWQGLGYRTLPDAGAAHPLFDFAAVPFPSAALALAWGAHLVESIGTSFTLVGAILGERVGGTLFLHGPVVHVEAPVDAPDDSRPDPLEIAAQLVAAALDHARALGVETVFTRPGGLDRVWVRFGFIPVPESALPEALAGRPGAGLYAWRGGTALWTFREAREPVAADPRTSAD